MLRTPVSGTWYTLRTYLIPGISYQVPGIDFEFVCRAGIFVFDIMFEVLVMVHAEVMWNQRACSYGAQPVGPITWFRSKRI